METRVCKECNQTLPIESFQRIRGGMRLGFCKDCMREIRRANKAKKEAEREQKRVYYDTLFDNKEPVDVLKIMHRAKKWLECRGYEIHLSGSYTIKREIKFNDL